MCMGWLLVGYLRPEWRAGRSEEKSEVLSETSWQSTGKPLKQSKWNVAKSLLQQQVASSLFDFVVRDAGSPRTLPSDRICRMEACSYAARDSRVADGEWHFQGAFVLHKKHEFNFRHFSRSISHCFKTAHCTRLSERISKYRWYCACRHYDDHAECSSIYT